MRTARPPNVSMARSTQTRRRAGLTTFPKQILSGSVYPAPDSTPPTRILCLELFKSFDLIALQPTIFLSFEPLPLLLTLATSARPPAAASRQSLWAYVSSWPFFKSSIGSKAILKEDHFSGAWPLPPRSRRCTPSPTYPHKEAHEKFLFSDEPHPYRLLPPAVRSIVVTPQFWYRLSQAT